MCCKGLTECFFHSFSLVFGVLDAEVIQKDDTNFARPQLGLLPIYCFPSDAQDLSANPTPAVTINGAWFQVNRVAPEAKTGDDALQGEVERLLSTVSDLQFQLDSKDIEITELKEKVEDKRSVTKDDSEEIAILKSEIETLKRRLTQAQSRKISEIGNPNQSTPNRLISRSATPEPGGTPSSLSTTSNTPVPAGITYRESVIDVSTIMKVHEPSPRMAALSQTFDAY